VITKTEKGYDHLFYNDDPDNTLVASFDAFGIANILYPPGVDEAGGTLGKGPPGVGDAFYRPTGDLDKYAFWNRFGKQQVTHSGRPRIIVSPQGGQIFSEGGVEEMDWEWGGILEPMDPHLEVKMNSAMRLVTSCQVDVRVYLTTSKIDACFQCGLQLKRTDTYLNRNAAEQITSGPLRGKYELHETVKQKRGGYHESHGQKCSKILYTPPAPPSIATLKKEFEPVRDALLGKDLSQEFPKFKSLDGTPLAVVANLICNDLGEMNMLANKPTNKRFWSLDQTYRKQKDKPMMRTGPKKKKGEASEAIDPLENDEVDPLGEKKAVHMGAGYLPIPPVMKRASGAYRHRDGGPTNRKSLKCINAPGVVYKKDKYGAKHAHLQHFDNNKRREQFFNFVKDVKYKDKLITVCCLQQDSIRCRQSRNMCEDANGQLSRSEEMQKNHYIVEYNMTDSRFLMDNYKFRSVPMFLCYYNGKLVTATTTLNKGAAPTSLKDFIGQIALSLADARSNKFLPDDFQFLPGQDNALTMNFLDCKTKIRDDINERVRADYVKVQQALKLRNAEVTY